MDDGHKDQPRPHTPTAPAPHDQTYAMGKDPAKCRILRQRILEATHPQRE
jgi:hypothetical protein